MTEINNQPLWDFVRWLIPASIPVLIYLSSVLSGSLKALRDRVEHLHTCFETKLSVVESNKNVSHREIYQIQATTSERITRLEETARRMERLEGKVDSLSAQMDVKLSGLESNVDRKLDTLHDRLVKSINR
jgi:predicted RNase H-like nuclease (RuvC/YqgF family)